MIFWSFFPLNEHGGLLTPQILSVTDKMVFFQPLSAQITVYFKQSFKNHNVLGISQIRVINLGFIMSRKFLNFLLSLVPRLGGKTQPRHKFCIIPVRCVLKYAQVLITVMQQRHLKAPARSGLATPQGYRDAGLGRGCFLLGGCLTL